jgi:hypothetical protein
VTDASPTPDLFLFTEGVTVELKALESFDARRWNARWAEARRQSRNLVVDARPAIASATSTDLVLHLFLGRLKAQGHAFDRVLLIHGDTLEDAVLWVHE